MDNKTTADISAKLQAAWVAHKEKTGMSQLRGAQALGMGQSAFSQYLRGKNNGGIQPNHTFISKFARLVGISPADLGWIDSDVVVKTQFIPVKFKLCGASVSGKQLPVDTAIVNRQTFAVEPDGTSDIELSSNSYILVDAEQSVHDGDLVWAVTDDNGVISALFGRLVKGDQWVVVQSHNKVRSQVTTIRKTDKLNRVVGTYIPPQTSEIFVNG